MKKIAVLNNPLFEKSLFFLIALLYLIPVCLFKYIGSLDGPRHLLTSNIIAGLISGSDFYQQFFKLNSPVIGNSLGIYILGVLNLILPAWIAEKILLVSYLMAFFYGFRYLVVSIEGKVDYKLLIVFPFAFHSLFLLGYYNFSIAITLMFFSLGYLIRNDRNRKPATFFILTLLFTLTYYTHVVVFGILMLLSAAYLLYNFICDLIERNKKAVVRFMDRVWYYALAVLPGLILTWLYYNMMPDNTREPVSIGDFNRIRYLLDFDLLLGFIKETENLFTRVILYTLLAAAFLILLTGKKSAGNSGLPEEFVKGRFNFWLFASVLLFVVFFIVPNHMSLPVRMAILAVLMLIVWIVIQDTPLLVSLSVVVLINLMSLGLRVHQMREQKSLNEIILEIVAIDDQIPEKSLVYSTNYTENWVMQHFHSYLGTEKQLLDLNNTSASELFPMGWKSSNRPFLFMGAKDASTVSMVSNKAGFYPAMIADHVVILRYDLFNRAGTNDPVAEIIRRDFKEVAVSPKQKVGLLKFNRWPEVNLNMKYLMNNEISKANIEKKARESGIPFKDAVFKDALWLYDTSNK